ncbi:transglycosylase SLT domain-containing protein [Mycolicibacterium sp.]|uniref:lytic transglycosylase domain-containing protein n=1 Tax=Mycolicibacterium sp. TaxID=2320850 RepID=UPI003D0DD0BD
MDSRSAPAVLAALVVALAGCATTPDPGEATSSLPAPPPPSAAPAPAPVPARPEPAQPQLAADPVRIADDLVLDEWLLRDPASTEAALQAAARRQQKAYRVLARHPEWDAITRPRVPEHLLDGYDRNIDARRQLAAMSGGRGRPTLPAWRIHPPPPVAELLGHYRAAEAASGVGWNYLAAINLVETAFGRIAGVSTAGAQGPMQFMPSTFAVYGDGGDIWSPRDSIMAAGRLLSANGFARDRDQALFRYNNDVRYVRAINQYAAVIAAHPAALAGYHRWDVYYVTTAGDVLLPIGYEAAEPIPVGEYLAANPQ